MNARVLITAMLLAGCAAAAARQSDPAPSPGPGDGVPPGVAGEVLYGQHCASCHGPNGMGTALLARRVQPALLEQRDNLSASYVVMAARRGMGNMPALPRGELSDAELQVIADYLAAGPHTAKTGGGQ